MVMLRQMDQILQVTHFAKSLDFIVAMLANIEQVVISLQSNHNLHPLMYHHLSLRFLLLAATTIFHMPYSYVDFLW